MNHFFTLFIQIYEELENLLPEQPDLPVGQHYVLALNCGQLQPQVGHFRLDLSLLLPVLNFVRLDVEQHLFFAQFSEKVSKLLLYLAEKQQMNRVWM